MHDPMNRRNALKTLAATAGGILVAAPARGLETAFGFARTRAALPHRVVGLRSLGGSFRFDPAGLLIEPGETVRWLNMGDFHTTTAIHPRYGELIGGDLPLRIPEGAEPWHSGMLGLTAGTQFEHAFTVEGVYDYFCQPHYLFGMVGRIVVGAPAGGPAVTRPLDELPDAAQEEMPAIETITGPAGVTYEWASRVNGVLWEMAQGSSPTAPANAVADALVADARLARLGRPIDTLHTKARDFARGVTSGADYEAIGRLGDAVKNELRALRDDAGDA
ncbi:MAG: plastocyanin/azurin family copper-binding protein [Longimicrobiales bacterium]|nr:plastocyanin/azurin family copper-binding protein [Longimicrobiales bacterium]